MKARSRLGNGSGIVQQRFTKNPPVIHKQININTAVQEALRDIYNIPTHESLGTLMGIAEGVIADINKEDILDNNEPVTYSDCFVSLKKPFGVIVLENTKLMLVWNATASIKLVQDDTPRITRDVKYIPIIRFTVNIDFDRKSRAFRDKEIDDIIAESVLLNNTDSTLGHEENNNGR